MHPEHKNQHTQQHYKRRDHQLNNYKIREKISLSWHFCILLQIKAYFQIIKIPERGIFYFPSSSLPNPIVFLIGSTIDSLALSKVRINARLILPLIVIGKVSTNSIIRGHL